MWFTDNAWQPMLLFGILAMFAALTWYRQQKLVYLVLVFVCLTASVLTWFVEQSIITPQERVHDAVVDITHAFQERDLPRTLAHVSARGDDLKALITLFIDQVKIEEMRLTDIQVELTSGGTRAVSRFRLNAKFSLYGYSSREPTRWESRWQLEENEWKLIDVMRLDPLTGDVMYEDQDVRKLVR